MTLSWELGDQRHEVLAKTTELVVLIPQYMSVTGEHRSSCPSYRNMGWEGCGAFRGLHRTTPAEGKGDARPNNNAEKSGWSILWRGSGRTWKNRPHTLTFFRGCRNTTINCCCSDQKAHIFPQLSCSSIPLTFHQKQAMFQSVGLFAGTYPPPRLYSILTKTA